ncbi:MAG: right-handed parallel beta-helix repeat-containing protein [Betaproteobacteria bacterium]|nr:right-handed parallel beta-helix repeat-containing protein [Betaproteobacteria bacterium]
MAMIARQRPAAADVLSRPQGVAMSQTSRQEKLMQATRGVKGWIIVAGLASLSLGAPARAGTLTVNCPGDSLQAAVELAVAGDTIQVTGTCTESVLIRNEQVRIALDGQNVATISPTSGHAAFTVRGKGITIRNFTITGGPGAGIWVNRGSNAVITQNHIYAMGGNGITVNQLSFAVIRNNNIHDNAGDGIAISETSDSRIGFDQNYDTAASPNTIQGNGGRGITVSGSSKARIVGNTITGNVGDGIGVFRNAQADIAGNTLNSNGGSGVSVGFNGGVQLGEDNPSTFFDQPNITTAKNFDYGILCTLGAYVRGHLGNTNQIDGALAQTNLSASCPNSLVTP